MGWTPILAGGTPDNKKFLYQYTRLRFKLANYIAKHFKLANGVAELAKCRAYSELLKKAKAYKADIYIAHNLEALPVVINAATYHKTKSGFDAEDFHRQEVSDNSSELHFKIATYLEDKYILKADYVTAASPLIAKEYQRIYPQLLPVVINNVFELKHLQPSNNESDDKLKLFWFSQTIGKDRGLEEAISALNYLDNNDIELHLLGSLNAETETCFRNLITFKSTNIYFHKPILPEDIFAFSNKFDVGLALEIKTPLNRNICLTNKLFSYLISGLAIIASDTSAQKAFMEENEGIGFICSTGSSVELAKTIDILFNNRTLLKNCKMEASRLAMEKYNWELESKIFLSNIKSFF